LRLEGIYKPGAIYAAAAGGHPPLAAGGSFLVGLVAYLVAQPFSVLDPTVDLPLAHLAPPQ